MDNCIPLTILCEMCKKRLAFKWWPWTADGLRHEGVSMDACKPCFNSVWVEGG